MKDLTIEFKDRKALIKIGALFFKVLTKGGANLVYQMNEDEVNQAVKALTHKD